MLTWAMQGLVFEYRGRGTGMWQSTFALGQFVSTVTFSAVVGMTKNVMASFEVFAIVAFLVCLGGVGAIANIKLKWLFVMLTIKN